MKQSLVFYESEGDAWLKRNIHKLPPQRDPVQDIIEKLKIKPTSVLEIGCANGWRLEQLAETYHASAGASIRRLVFLMDPMDRIIFLPARRRIIFPRIFHRTTLTW